MCCEVCEAHLDVLTENKKITLYIMIEASKTIPSNKRFENIRKLITQTSEFCWSTYI